ncbi:alpha/beta fold hydrolase [Agromyces sp. Marseille-P2726]|uniref:alpha/beta fold hydrolase n=1 Tax=Agromyces sp. Marseille-P2726 TaxID=2709132 RepID=UPI0015711C1E|nr:alpha/beta hydrolase [Agromyces sp. Marseille-P2726]
MAAVRDGFVGSHEGQIHFLTAGHGDPLVLLPHGGRSAQMYGGLIPILAQHRRVIALDPPGTGESYLPDGRRSIPELAETLHAAARKVAKSRYTLYGMNGGNKLGAAMAAAHPEAIDGFIFAGLTHSIVLSNSAREVTLGRHPAVRLLLDADNRDDAWRRDFCRAVIDYDLETALRSLTVPLAVLEFATEEEDERIGRQGEALAAELGAAAASVIELSAGDPVSLEDRPDELAYAIRMLSDAMSHT